MRPVRPGSSGRPAANGGTRYVLNLCTSATRDALRRIVELPDPKRVNYFTSRSFEGGRERYRLHLGYFPTLAEAQSWLPALREAYPAAWAGQLPVAAQLDVPEVPEIPVAVPTVQAAQAPPAAQTLPNLQAVPVVRAAQEPPARGPIPVARPVIPSLAPAPRPPVLGAYSPGARSSGAAAVTQSGALRAVENRPATTSSTSSKLPAVRRSPPVPMAPAPDFYAVQLARAPLPMEIEDVPPIPILDEYTLYTVEGLREGARWYAVRVGFFDDLPSASAVAAKLRGDFAGLAIVGVSADEKRAATGEATAGPSSAEHARYPARQTTAKATRWTPSVAETSFGAALVPVNPDDSMDRMVSASGEFAAGFLQQLGVRKRRLLRGRPFLRLLERIGGRIRDL